MINFIQLPSTTHANGLDNSIDNNFNTAIGGESHAGNNTSVNNTTTSAHTFANPVHLKSVVFKASASCAADSHDSHGGSCYIRWGYKQSGDIVYTYPNTSSAGNPGNVSYDETPFVVDIINVVAIIGEAHGDANNSGGGTNDGQSNCSAYIFEIQAFGDLVGGYAFVA